MGRERRANTCGGGQVMPRRPNPAQWSWRKG